MITFVGIRTFSMAYDVLLRTEFEKVGNGVRFDEWRRSYKISNPKAAMFAQIADLCGIVSLLDSSVRTPKVQVRFHRGLSYTLDFGPQAR